MSLEEFEQDNKAVSGFKGSMDLFMGAIYLAVTGFCYFKKESIDQFKIINPFLFIVLFGLYGVFRIYRGWQKMRGVFRK